MKTNLCILAAGNSSRFHDNKLITDVLGKPLICHLLDRIDETLFDSIILVTQYEEVKNIAKNYPCHVVFNKYPEKGISHSIHLGIQASQADQILFLVADQPCIKNETILSLLEQSDGNSIVACKYNDTLMNPMIFPNKYFDELLDLSGDMGAKRVALKHFVKTVDVDSIEVFDVDTKEDLERLSQMMK